MLFDQAAQPVGYVPAKEKDSIGSSMRLYTSSKPYASFNDYSYCNMKGCGIFLTRSRWEVCHLLQSGRICPLPEGAERLLEFCDVPVTSRALLLTPFPSWPQRCDFFILKVCCEPGPWETSWRQWQVIYRKEGSIFIQCASTCCSVPGINSLLILEYPIKAIFSSHRDILF